MAEMIEKSETNNTGKSTAGADSAANKLISSMLIGIAVGLTSFLVYWLMTTYAVQAINCDQSETGICASAVQISEGVAIITGSALGLWLLMRARVYRPLLIVLAAAASLGGLAVMSADAMWYRALAAAVLLGALAYGTFSWIASARNFWLALIAGVAVAAALRLTLFGW